MLRIRLRGDDAAFRARLIRRYPDLAGMSEQRWACGLRSTDKLEKEARSAARAMVVLSFASLYLPLLFAGSAVSGAWLGGGPAVGDSLDSIVRYASAAAAVAVALVSIFSGFVLGRWVLMRLVKELFDSMLPECPRCRYSLIGARVEAEHGHEQVACPECGLTLKLGDYGLSSSDLAR